VRVSGALEEVAAEIRARGRRALVASTDVGDRAQAEELVRAGAPAPSFYSRGRWRRRA
jgi:hypothetical protein